MHIKTVNTYSDLTISTLISQLNPEMPWSVVVCVAAELMLGNPFKLRANFTH